MSTFFTFFTDDSLVAPVPVDLDRRRHLKLGKGAIFRAEKVLCEFWGKRQNILTVLADPNGLTLNDTAILLWQGLLHEDPFLTLEEAQRLMTMDNLPAILAAIFQAWQDSTQAVDADTGSNGDGPDPSWTVFPGPSSGATPAANSD